MTDSAPLDLFSNPVFTRETLYEAHEIMTGRVWTEPDAYELVIKAAEDFLTWTQDKIRNQISTIERSLWERAKAENLIRTYMCPEGHEHRVFTKEPFEEFHCSYWTDEYGSECGKDCSFTGYYQGDQSPGYDRMFSAWCEEDPLYKILTGVMKGLQTQKSSLSSERYKHHRAREPRSTRHKGEQFEPHVMLISHQLWEDLKGLK